MNKPVFYFVLASVFILFFPLLAKGEKAHVHGSLSIFIAIENNKIEIALESPAEALVGFEHKASSLKEKQLVEQTEKQLKSPDLFFSFNGASCKPDEIKVELSSIEAEHHSDHDNDHHSDKHNENKHNDITAMYGYTCDQASNIKSIYVDFFKAFAKVEKVKVVWITETGQGSNLLNRKNNQVVLISQ